MKRIRLALNVVNCVKGGRAGGCHRLSNFPSFTHIVLSSYTTIGSPLHTHCSEILWNNLVKPSSSLHVVSCNTKKEGKPVVVMTRRFVNLHTFTCTVLTPPGTLALSFDFIVPNTQKIIQLTEICCSIYSVVKR
jgi:hypothetical protein